MSGKEALDIVTNAMAFSFDHDKLKSQHEVDLIAKFFQTMSEWGDISDELEIGQRVEIAYNLTQSLQELEQAGFFVFGGREIQLIEGGVIDTPSNWPIAILRVVRKDNNEIIKVDLNNSSKEH